MDAASGKLPSQRYYRPELDVLRFFALSLVFVFHIFQVYRPGSPFTFLDGVQETGAAGVCIFFTLSAFLITELLLREREGSGTIDIQAFYVRRVLRIWPLYFLTIFLAVLASHVVRHSFTPVGPLVLPSLLFCGNWAVVLHGWPLNPLMSPLWSISVEEQFYLLWPFLVLRWGARGVLRAALMLLPLAWATDLLFPLLGWSKTPALWANSLNQFQFFAVGATVAVLLHRRPVRFSPALRCALLGAALVLLYLASSPFQYINPEIHSGPLRMLGGYWCLDAACILLLLGTVGARLSGLSRPLVYLGKISYGLYVFHLALGLVVHAMVSLIVTPRFHLGFAAQLGVTFTVTAVLTVVLASLSYHFYELPFLRLKRRFTVVPSRAT